MDKMLLCNFAVSPDNVYRGLPLFGVSRSPGLSGARNKFRKRKKDEQAW